VSSNISRKDFLRNLSWLIVLPFAFLAGHSFYRHFSWAEKRSLRISAELNPGVTFLEEVIVVKNNNELSIFSSRCPHLGCRIGSVENGELVCPCHGSKFNFEGINTKGPANTPLKRLEYDVDSSSGEIIINV
jgi:Rieske Fe-S protein